MKKKILLIWYSPDGGRTRHEFEWFAQAEEWLAEVLSDLNHEAFGEWAINSGYPMDGFGLLVYRYEEGFDHLGDFEAFYYGQRVDPHDLAECAIRGD